MAEPPRRPARRTWRPALGVLALAVVAGLVALAVRGAGPPARPAATPPTAAAPRPDAAATLASWEAGSSPTPEALGSFVRALASATRDEGAALAERAAALLEARLPGAPASEWGEPVRALFSAWRSRLPGDPFPALDPSSPRVQERYLALRASLRSSGADAAAEARALAEGGRDLGDDWWRRRNGPAALAAYEEARRRLDASRAAEAPDDGGRSLLADIESGRGVVLLNLFRWSDAEAALRTAVEAREATSPAGTGARDLAVDRARWGWALLYAGQTDPALAQLEQAVAALGDGVDAVPPREPGPATLRARLRIARMVAGDDASGPPADRLEVARVHLARRDGVAALPHFEAALTDPRLRADLREAPLYDAACAASIAAETAPPAERDALLARGLRWFEEDLALRRRAVAEVEASGAEDDVAAARARLETHLDWARGDPDIAFLRATPAVEALLR